VIPCFPDKRRAAWLDDAIGGFAMDAREPAYGRRSWTIGLEGARGSVEVTWHDSRGLQPLEEPGRRVSATVAITGTEADGRRALVAEEDWETERKERRRAARKVAPPVYAAVDAAPAPEAAEPEKPAADETTAEMAEDGAAAGLPDARAEAFGRLVHALLALPDGKGRAASASALAPQYGLGEADATRAADLVARARKLPEIAAAAKADLVYRDLPFAVPVRGELAIGRIDLAYRKGSAWTVIDFKTAGFADPGPALAAHGPQIAAGAEALATVTGASAPRALFLLGDGRLAAAD
jgi:ATP-dependent exoDNAse (exonuclease V) beta subunit